MESHAATGTRPLTARAIALVTAMLLGVLGLSAPTAAGALDGNPPTGNRTVSGTISFPASAPANVRKAINPKDSGPGRAGVYLTLSVDKPGSVDGWELGVDGNVLYNQSTGAWSVTGVGDARYRLTVNVILPGYGATGHSSQIVTVNGANVAVSPIVVSEKAQLRTSFGFCSWLAGNKFTAYAKNRSTGKVYSLSSGQSGWMQPYKYCIGEAGFGNYDIAASAPAGSYTVYFDWKGKREYFTGDDFGSLKSSDAKPVALKYWEGTWLQTMVGFAIPISSATPKIAASKTAAGTVKVGKTLAARPGAWTKGTVFKYQWTRNGKPIAGATKSKYRLVNADAKKKVGVRVLGLKPGYHPKTKKSSTAKIAKLRKLKSAAPKISGTKKVGKALRVERGSWTKGTKFSYRWYRNGKAIAGAKKSSYTLTADDAGKRITVKVTGKKTGYATKKRGSAPTSKIRR